MIRELYRPSLALLTDLYQLTMAFGYWKTGMATRESVFQLVFREHPFGGQFAIACGLDYVIDALSHLRFSADDLRYLSTLTGADGRPLFDEGFLEMLSGWQFVCDVDAIPEGTVVFAQEPLVRVRGPLWQCQFIETLLLNMINFQTLIATKAARICLAAEGQPVLEFGLRRAQGVDGGITASRAAYIGGCTATSNVMAGKLFGIPVKGTHAHSWVMAFEDEKTSFEAYARALPNNSIFLVDTYDTREGVRRAAEVGDRLRAAGHSMVGVRLDSGDLATLSRAARQILDDEGFDDAIIVASNDLDEERIRALKAADAKIDVWGVGTRLATAYDQPALGGVYKLSAIRDDQMGEWTPRIKLSQQPVKISNPGMLQARRYRHADGFLVDLLFNELTPLPPEPRAVDPLTGEPWPVPAAADHEDLLVPVFRRGAVVYESPSPHVARDRTRQQLDGLPPAVKRFEQPLPYPVVMDPQLFRLKQRLRSGARGAAR